MRVESKYTNIVVAEIERCKCKTAQFQFNEKERGQIESPEDNSSHSRNFQYRSNLRCPPIKRIFLLRLAV